jgi:hypothetical protein
LRRGEHERQTLSRSSHRVSLNAKTLVFPLFHAAKTLTFFLVSEADAVPTQSLEGAERHTGKKELQ